MSCACVFFIFLSSPLIKTPKTTLSRGCSWCEVRSLPPFCIPEEAFSLSRLSTLSTSGDPGLGASPVTLAHSAVTLSCHTLLSHSAVTLYCHTLLSHFTVIFCCHTLLSQFTITLCCHTLLSHSAVTLSHSAVALSHFAVTLCCHS